ncbi:hypothetical protein QNO07_17280 [Streptomyces sp. 549]|uniref:DUF6571 family protein n=1 Tax=Streptomyces sp. 549 TaxID=3049076 RepID=UPI0024C368EC|nr:DUF6571 family protein [Streptomyces sp. 549]MDK1475146.1 hypothetical protein [Streptomyces sp. 549]
MPALTFSNLRQISFNDLGKAVTDWTDLVQRLDKLDGDARDGMLAKSERARWDGLNATVTRRFVKKTSKEFGDALAQARSIRNVLRDAHTDLVEVQKQLAAVVSEASAAFIHVRDNKDGTVTCQGPGGPGPTADSGSEQGLDPVALQRRINQLIARAEEIDNSASRALRKAHGGDAHDFGHATYKSLDEAQAERANELAALGPKMTDKQYAELNTLLKHNGKEPNGEFATRFYKGLGGPEEALRFYGRMSLDGTDGDNSERLALARELQRGMGHTLANATDPDAPKGHDGPKQHLPESWGKEFRRLGTQPLDVKLGAWNSPYGYQVLGGLLRYGDYDPSFLNPIAEHVVQLQKDDPLKFVHNMPSGGDTDYGFNPSGKVGTGYAPITSVLEALGHSPEAAEKFFSETPTAYREDGSVDKGAKADFGSYVKLMAGEDFPWGVDIAGGGFDDRAAALQHGPDAFGHALEAATTGVPYDGDPLAIPPKHSEAAAGITQEIFEAFGEKPNLLDDKERLSPIRDSLGRITADYIADVDRSISQSGSDTTTYPPFGVASQIDPDDARKLLQALGREPDSYGTITNAQRAYTEFLMDRAINPSGESQVNIGIRVENAADPGATISGIMSQARADATRADSGDFIEAAEKKGQWVERTLSLATGSIGDRVPVVGDLADWAVEDIKESMLKQVEEEAKESASNEAGKDFTTGRQSVISHAEDAVNRAIADNPDINEQTRVDLRATARRQSSNSHSAGATWSASDTVD